MDNWNDYFDTPLTHYQQQRQHNAVEEYQWVDKSLRKYRKPPAHFFITIKCIDGDSQKTTCYPGSTIEGTVKIKLDTPLSAHHMKLVFKGSEIIYDQNMGKLSNMNSHSRKKKGDQFFAVRTTLWGIHRQHIEDDTKWPLLDAGDHQFPFMCELPMVNYPPTFRHHLVACEFEMVASLERPGIRPFQTIPFSIRYEPYVLSTLVKYPEPCLQQKVMQSHKLKLCLLKGRDYNILDTDTMPIHLHIQGDQNNIKHIEVFLKRKVIINYGSYHQTDSMVMSYMEQSKFKQLSRPDQCVNSIALPIPIEKSKKRDEILSKNFSVLGMTTTVTKDLSRYVQIEYQLQVTARIKHNFIWTKSKLLFSIPLHFGTIAPQLPFNLLHYRDDEVVNDQTLSTKPKFIKVPHRQYQEQLPSYSEDISPPVYHDQQQTNRLRLMIS